MKFKCALSSLVIAVVMVVSCAFGMVGCGGSLKGGGDVLDGKWEIVAWDGYGAEPTGQVIFDNEKKTLDFNTVDKKYGIETEIFSKGKKTDYRTKSYYSVHHKGIDNKSIDISAFSDNVMRIAHFYVQTTPGELEELTGATIIRRVKDTPYVEKSKLSGTFTMPEDFDKDLGLTGEASPVRITKMEISGDEVSFGCKVRPAGGGDLTEQTFKQTLIETPNGYGFKVLLTGDFEEAGRYLHVEIVETGENYITLYYSITLGISSTKTSNLCGVTLVKA